MRKANMMTSIEGKVLRSGLDAPQHALDVDLQNRARFFCCDIHKGLHLCNPGVVEHHVEPAELLLGTDRLPRRRLRVSSRRL